MKFKERKIIMKTLLILFLAVGISAHPQKHKVLIAYVIDGDTIKVFFQGRKESVRLIGIDTPESRRNSRAKRIARKTGKTLKCIIQEGKLSKKYVKSLVKKGDSIYLEFDIQQRDRYRRILAYVYLSNGKMLNEEILKAGYGTPYTVPPNIKYVERFLEIYKQARYERKGLWR